jgi:hypothetical protein
MIVAALLLTFQPVDLNDFFPARPGTRWTYRDTLYSYVDEVLEPVEYGGGPAIPVRTSAEGKVMETIYYRITPARVEIAGYDADKPLPAPIPVFRIDERRWSFTGVMPTLGEESQASIKGSSALKGKREWMGERRDILEVKLEASFGGEKANAMNVRQTAIYAKGVGLISMEQVTRIGKNDRKSRVELVKYEPAPAGRP